MSARMLCSGPSHLCVLKLSLASCNWIWNDEATTEYDITTGAYVALWYVSNVSIILIVPCYYIFCFGCLMGLFIHFYIIFGTNLLTQGPVQIDIFFAYFSVSQKRNIKRNETFGSVIFGTNMIQRTWSGRQETNKVSTRQGARLPP